MVNPHQKLLDSPEFKASVEMAKEVLRECKEMNEDVLDTVESDHYAHRAATSCKSDPVPTEVWVVTSGTHAVKILGAESGEGSVIHFTREDAEVHFAMLYPGFRKSFRIARALLTIEPEEGSPPRPEVVTLCGSTKFKEDYERVQMELTLQGKVVISVGLFGHRIGLDMTGDVKKMLDELHLRKIDMADTVFFVNKDGYIGESTRRELTYARSKGKKIEFMEPDKAPKE